MFYKYAVCSFPDLVANLRGDTALADTTSGELQRENGLSCAYLLRRPGKQCLALKIKYPFFLKKGRSNLERPGARAGWAGLTVTVCGLFVAAAIGEERQNHCAFFTDGVQLAGIDSQSLQNGYGHL